MNKLKIGFLALSFTCFSLAHAGSTPGSSYQFAAVECTPDGPGHVHISCKVSEANTGNKVELPTDLINYDVRNKDGQVIASGHGNNAAIDESKFESEEDYTINVYALVNGDIVSQAVNMKAPVKK